MREFDVGVNLGGKLVVGRGGCEKSARGIEGEGRIHLECEWECRAMGTGSRRAVVRSERFMEWQRELSRSVSAVRKLGHTSALLTTERQSSDEDNVKMQRRDVSEERDGEGEEAVADSEGGTDVSAGNHRHRGKKTHQRQRSDTKKPRKDEDGGEKKSGLTTIKESATGTDGDGGRIRRCKQQVNQAPAAKRPAPQVPNQQHLPPPMARGRQRRVPSSFTPPKEDVERELRSLTSDERRNRGNGSVPTTTAAAPTNSSKGATKRSKRVAQRLANEEPAPPPLKLPKLHLVLTRKEIQEDWLKITGHKYTGKPRKSSLIQRGLGLCTALTCPSSIRYLNEPQCRVVQHCRSPDSY
ncbi:uncharacterized protein [Physcomitrium patens]|uniref:uncharacterized protein isoform X3 n=1 Tax=Physcomitrium patens TaxID=3218 RepID=UPI000D1642CB|nr:uncharacterized protein LOC112280284 isoform X3 [Physcomitrium patens]|eukprot:XP_024371370.1 uncharacterized protein LOC112280284 isoform X3 [Physcomitrella patens]